MRSFIENFLRDHGWRVIRVGMVGAVGFVIQTIIFEVVGIRLMLVAASTAAVIGGECAILSNFFLNNRFSFSETERRTGNLFARLVRFHIVSSGSLATQWIILLIAERLTSDLLLLRFSYLFGIGLGFIFNYLGYHFFVWRRHSQNVDSNSIE